MKTVLGGLLYLTDPDEIIPGDYVRDKKDGEIGWVFNQWHVDGFNRIIIDLGTKGVKTRDIPMDRCELVGCRWPNKTSRYCKVIREVR